MAYLGKNAYASYAPASTKEILKSGKLPMSSSTNPKAANFQPTYQGKAVASYGPVQVSAPAPEKPASSTQKKSSGSSQKKSSGSSPKLSASAPTELDIFAEQTGLAKDQAAQQASQLQSEYDYARELLAGQEQQAVSERDIAKSQLEQALQQVMKQGGRAKESAVQQAESATEQAASAAKQAERKTRGILRGLGILASSAAGELLSRPATEFQKVGADIQTQLSNKIKEVDDFLTAKTEENALKVQELLSNYASIVDRIRTDLRFNQREKLSALQQNKLALGQALSEIKANQVNYQMATNTYKNNLLSEAGGLGTPLRTSGIQERIMGQTPQAPKQQTTQDADILKRRRDNEPSMIPMGPLV